MTKLYYHMFIAGKLHGVYDVNLPSAEALERARKNREMVRNNENIEFWVHLEQNERDYVKSLYPYAL